MSSARATALLLNLGHALDHRFLLLTSVFVAFLPGRVPHPAAAPAPVPVVAGGS